MTPNKRKKKECKSALDRKMKHWSEMRGWIINFSTDIVVVVMVVVVVVVVALVLVLVLVLVLKIHERNSL